MARYEDVAPGIGWLEEILHTGIFKHHVLEKCCICGSLTTFCDMDFGAPMCSEECSKEMWKKFTEACNR